MLLIIAIPFLLLELYLSLEVGENIGFLWSAIWIVVSMLIGFRLLQSSSLTLMGNLNSVSRGKLSMQSFQNASTAYLIGALFLIIPGVLTDLFGLIALSYTVYLQFVAKITPEQTKFNPKKGDDNVIDVEIIDEHTDHNSRD
ncbi:MAG: FxsA family protein [Campylobacterota bacterium]|nr:FxsA family protein [Campylobacterota bacterium]